MRCHLLTPRCPGSSVPDGSVTVHFTGAAYFPLLEPLPSRLGFLLPRREDNEATGCPGMTRTSWNSRTGKASGLRYCSPQTDSSCRAAVCLLVGGRGHRRNLPHSSNPVGCSSRTMVCPLCRCSCHVSFRSYAAEWSRTELDSSRMEVMPLGIPTYTDTQRPGRAETTIVI